MYKTAFSEEFAVFYLHICKKSSTFVGFFNTCYE